MYLIQYIFCMTQKWLYLKSIYADQSPYFTCSSCIYNLVLFLIFSLQMLHIHNNHLNSLPTEMSEMSSLKILVLAFNHFTTIPEVLLQSQNSKSNLDSIIMAGNRVEKLPHEVLCRMQHIKKIDLRMNSLSLLPSETAKFHFLELVTHLDVRDNQIKDLDVRSLKSLEYLNCERNGMQSLQVNGSSLKNLYATDNSKTHVQYYWVITLRCSQFDILTKQKILNPRNKESTKITKNLIHHCPGKMCLHQVVTFQKCSQFKYIFMILHKRKHRVKNKN